MRDNTRANIAENGKAPDHAEFVSDDTEDEVGVAHAQEAARILGTDRIAFAQDAAGADADARLIDIVGAVGIQIRIDKGLNAARAGTVALAGR